MADDLIPSPPEGAKQRIKDPSGNVVGYRMADNSIKWVSSKGEIKTGAYSGAPPAAMPTPKPGESEVDLARRAATAPEGAKQIIRDPSGSTAGYRMTDGSIRWLEGHPPAPTVPAAPAPAGGPVSPGAPPAAKPMGGPDTGTTIQKAESWPVWAAKRGVEVAGGTLGGVSGAALGAIPAIGEAVTVAGIPAAAATEYGSTQAGVAAGLTGADLVNAELDKYLYGRTIDSSKKTLLKDYLYNLAGAVGSDQVIRWLPGIVGKVLGITDAKEALQSAVEFGGAQQRDYLEKAEEKAGGVLKGSAAAQESAMKEVEPAARQEIAAAATGKTPETAGAAAAPPMAVSPEGVTAPTDEALAQRKDVVGSYFNIKNRVGRTYGKGYEDLLGKYNQVNVPDTGDIRKVLDKWEGIYTRKGEETRTAMADLMKDAQDLSPRSFLDVAQAAARGPISPRAKAKLLESGDVVSAGPTVERLRAFKGRAERFAASTTNDQEATVGEELARAADTMLEKSKALPDDVRQKLAALNSRYNHYKLTFNRQIRKGIVTSTDPVAASDEIFSNPNLTQYVIGNANPEEKARFKDAFGQWIGNHDPSKVLAKTPAEAEAKSRAYAQIVPGTPLANPKSLMYVSGELKNLEAAPQAYGQAEAGWTQAMRELQAKGAKDVRDIGVTRLKTLGAVGQRVIKQVQNAKTPQEQAEIVDKFFRQMTPESLGQQIGQAQTLRGGLVPKQIGPQPEKFSGTWVTHMMARPGAAMWYLATAALSGISYGHPSPFWTMMGLGAGWMGTRRMIQAATIKALASPNWAPVMSSLSNKAYTALGSSVARAVMADAVSNAAKSTMGFTLEEPEKGTSPVVKSAESKRAAAIAGPHATADKIGDVAALSKKVTASGKTTDVHRDITSGRVSLGHVRKMLDAGSGTDLASTFQGLSPADTIDVLAKASPGERETFFPAVLQKLNDSRNQMSPQQSQMLMAQLQRMMSAPEATA